MDAVAPTSARLYGESLGQLPKDLYIPPEALEIILEAFEGPLDLLLYLIRKQNIDILDIPIVEITQQYMGYIELMDTLDLDLAAEYLVMAAVLGEIKSRMLLPRSDDELDDELDPRAELVRRLQQYEVFRKAAFDLDELPRDQRDVISFQMHSPEVNQEPKFPEVELTDLMLAFAGLLRREDQHVEHQVSAEQLSVNEKMSYLLDQIPTQGRIELMNLIVPEEGRLGVVVTFMATLELVKKQILQWVQTELFAPIYLKKRVMDAALEAQENGE